MDIAFEDSSGTFVMRVSGDLRLWGHEDGQERLVTLVRAQENPPKRMILNLTDVKQLDSLGVGALARVVVECGKREVDLKVVLPTGVAGKVLGMLHIFAGWPAFPDETAALRDGAGSS